MGLAQFMDRLVSVINNVNAFDERITVLLYRLTFKQVENLRNDPQFLIIDEKVLQLLNTSFG